MPDTLVKDAEREIIEEGGMSVEDYRRTIDELEQSRLNMDILRNISRLTTSGPTVVKEVKAIEIQKKLELEKRKTDGQAAVSRPYIRWVILYDSVAASRRYMEIEVDEGANANFLTQGMAADRRFQVQSLEKPFEGQTINGDVVCYEYAKVTLFDGNHDEHCQIEADFYVLPANGPPNDPRIDKPIVGRHLLREAERLLLTEDPRDPVWTTKMGKESVYMKEQRKQQATNVDAYQANASRNRDASRSIKDNRDKKAQDGGSSSRAGDKKGH